MFLLGPSFPSPFNEHPLVGFAVFLLVRRLKVLWGLLLAVLTLAPATSLASPLTPSFCRGEVENVGK